MSTSVPRQDSVSSVAAGPGSTTKWQMGRTLNEQRAAEHIMVAAASFDDTTSPCTHAWPFSRLPVRR